MIKNVARNAFPDMTQTIVRIRYTEYNLLKKKKKKKRFFVQEHKKIVPKSTLLRVACIYKINVMKTVLFTLLKLSFIYKWH